MVMIKAPRGDANTERWL